MENLLSVTEYSARYGKDPGNVRRMLAQGRLAGFKVGNQWVIPEGSEYPADRRERTGRYRNWRKRPEVTSNPIVLAIKENLCLPITGIYGSIIQAIILYGSYARGTQTEDSDIDIALLLEGSPTAEMTDQMIALAASVGLEIGKEISIVDVDFGRFQSWKGSLPFYKNIDREGIVLWEKK